MSVLIVGNKIHPYLRLTRFQEFFYFVIVTTLLGANTANGFWGWRLAGVLAANWLAVAFAFMINDVEDAPEDALNPAKAKRNPVAASDLSPRPARIASFGVALLAALMYALLGLRPFLAGLICLVIGFLYSWRPVRIKTIPFLDMLSHCFMLAGLQFLAAYFTFEPGEPGRWLFPLIFILAISLYGELFNELRDLDEDIKAGLTHTASLLGARITYWLMMGCLAAGVASLLVSIFVVRLIPGWVVVLLIFLAVILARPALVRIHEGQTAIGLQQSFQKPLEMAAAASLLVQFIGTWAVKMLN